MQAGEAGSGRCRRCCAQNCCEHAAGRARQGVSAPGRPWWRPLPWGPRPRTASLQQVHAWAARAVTPRHGRRAAAQPAAALGGCCRGSVGACCHPPAPSRLTRVRLAGAVHPGVHPPVLGLILLLLKHALGAPVRQLRRRRGPRGAKQGGRGGGEAGGAVRGAPAAAQAHAAGAPHLRSMQAEGRSHGAGGAAVGAHTVQHMQAGARTSSLLLRRQSKISAGSPFLWMRLAQTRVMSSRQACAGGRER